MDAEARTRGGGAGYLRVAARSWSCLSSAGDADATWQAVQGGRRQLVLRAPWGWLGELPAGSPPGLAAAALQVAAPVWSTIRSGAGWPALAVATSKGDIACLASAAAAESRSDAAALWRSAPGMLAPALASALGTGIYLPLGAAAACSSGLYALLAAADSIEQGRCQRALVVAAERSLTPLVLAGFQAIGASCGSALPTADGGGALGFAPADGVSAIALATSGPWRLLAGMRAGDAGHATAFSHPEALAEVLRCLWRWAPQPDGILIHGTGTAVGEAYESAALELGPWRSAPRLRCKPWIGHALGASSLVELCAAWQAGADRWWQISLGFGGHLAGAAWQRTPP